MTARLLRCWTGRGDGPSRWRLRPGAALGTHRHPPHPAGRFPGRDRAPLSSRVGWDSAGAGRPGRSRRRTLCAGVPAPPAPPTALTHPRLMHPTLLGGPPAGPAIPIVTAETASTVAHAREGPALCGPQLRPRVPEWPRSPVLTGRRCPGLKAAGVGRPPGGHPRPAGHPSCRAGPLPNRAAAAGGPPRVPGLRSGLRVGPGARRPVRLGPGPWQLELLGLVLCL